MTQHTEASLLKDSSLPHDSVLSPWASVVISHIPIPVVLGVFLYLAYISLYGVQLVHRLKLLFIPSKYHRDMPFTKSIRLWKLNVYTTTQLVLVAVLWVVKFTPVAMFYPLLVILLIPIHKFIKWFIFTETEVQLVNTMQCGHWHYTLREREREMIFHLVSFSMSPSSLILHLSSPFCHSSLPFSLYPSPFSPPLCCSPLPSLLPTSFPFPSH